MSEIEHKKGKLIVRNKENESLKECIERIMKENNYDLNLEFREDIESKFLDFFDRRYYINKGKVYQILLNDVSNYEDIYDGVWISDEEIEVELRWYNGGRSMREMLDKIF